MRRTTVHYIFFLMFVLLVTLAFVGLIQDFLLPLFWAATLAIVFYPVCQWVQSRLGTRASVAALLTLGVILVAVILPLSLIGVAVVQEAAALYKRLETGDITVQEPLQMLERLLSVLTQYLNRLGIETQNLTQSLAGATVTVSRFVGTQALNLGQDALRLSVMFALMLYLLFFFLRDGPQIVTAILHALPLGNTRARRLFDAFCYRLSRHAQGYCRGGAGAGASRRDPLCHRRHQRSRALGGPDGRSVALAGPGVGPYLDPRGGDLVGHRTHRQSLYCPGSRRAGDRPDR